MYIAMSKKEQAAYRRKLLAYMRGGTRRPEDLIKEWDYIVKTYFPRWRSFHKWDVSIAFEISDQYKIKSAGVTLLDENKIYVLLDAYLQPIHKLRCLLIHEICHSIYRNSGHGKRWRDRMWIAQLAARRSGDIQLADEICANIEEGEEQAFNLRFRRYLLKHDPESDLLR